MGKKCGCDPTRKDGGIDYRYKRGNDRTPAQRTGDKKRRKK